MSIMLPRLVCMLTAWLLFCHVAQAEIHLTDAEGRQVTLAAPHNAPISAFTTKIFWR